MTLDVGAYLDRLGLARAPAPSLMALRELHVAHLVRVPFENLDIHERCPIVLDVAALFTKVVTRRRGGFCYELNGLLAALLGALGYRVTMVSARVATGDGELGPEFDHLALIVDVDAGRWLCDVGFGDSFLEPLALGDGAPQASGGHLYELGPEGDAVRLSRRAAGGAPSLQYVFTTIPRRLEDFAAMCLHHQTSPASPFTRKRVCTRATERGRITLSDRRLIVTEDGERQERLLEDDRAVTAALRQHFGVLV
jgi:N-hydroxyarylamine O-acetyltransferase